MRRDMMKKTFPGVFALVVLALAVTAPVRAEYPLDCKRINTQCTGRVFSTSCHWNACTTCSGRCCYMERNFCDDGPPNMADSFSQICGGTCTPFDTE